MLLQTGGPGVSEMLFAVVIGGLLAAVAGYMIYRDAGSRGSDDARLWGLGTAAVSILLPVIGTVLAIVVYYLVVIRE